MIVPNFQSESQQYLISFAPSSLPTFIRFPNIIATVCEKNKMKRGEPMSIP